MKQALIPACILTGLCLIFSCTPNPYKSTNKAYRKEAKGLARELRAEPYADSLQPPPYWVGTTNFGLRKPGFVIIHHTAQDACEKTLKTFTMPVSKVSAHYVICKDGTVHHMLNDYLRAWHGGTVDGKRNPSADREEKAIRLLRVETPAVDFRR